MSAVRVACPGGCGGIASRSERPLTFAQIGSMRRQGADWVVQLTSFARDMVMSPSAEVGGERFPAWIRSPPGRPTWPLGVSMPAGARENTSQLAVDEIRFPDG